MKKKMGLNPIINAPPKMPRTPLNVNLCGREIALNKAGIQLMELRLIVHQLDRS
jgi:hypothetical protein